MKKKTVAILGISALCIVGFGAGVQASYTAPCAANARHTGDSTSSWQTTQRQKMMNLSTRKPTEVSIPVAEPIVNQVPITEVNNETPCPYGYNNCDGNHEAGYHHAKSNGGRHQGNGHRGGHH